MKQFNLKEAKAGKPVCTREGNSARIICFNRKSKYYPIVALISKDDHEDAHYFTKDGKYLYEGNLHEFDLFMVPEHHVGYANLYRTDQGSYATGLICESKDTAMDGEITEILSGYQYINTIKIEWDE